MSKESRQTRRVQLTLNRSGWVLAVAIATASVTACSGGSGGPDATVCHFDLAWGYLEEGEFRPFVDGDAAEITLGFQGFRYIYSSVRLSDTNAEPDTARLEFQIAVEEQEIYVQGDGITEIHRGTDDALYAHDLLVFFNDIPIPELVGRTATIVARATAAGCTGSYAASVRLADEDHCIDLEDGGVQCDGFDAGV